MESSKFQALLLSEKTGYLQQEIIQPPCECEICFNDVRPIVKPEQERQKSSIEFGLSETQAIHFYCQKVLGFRGFFFIPDTFFISDSQIYFTNDMGRLKCKQKQTNLDAKKHFDEKKRKYQKGYKNKQIAILIFKSGCHQLLTQSHLNKVLLKRKNDPLWQEAKAIVLLPPTQEVLQYQEYLYKRNQQTVLNTEVVYEKVVQDVDAYEEKTNKDESLKNASLILMMSKSKFGFLIDHEKMIQETIAYIEIVHKVRILGAHFYYMLDPQGQPYLMEIKNFVAAKLRPQEQQLALHDRYKQLDIIGEEELINVKVKMDHQDEEALWSLCTELTKNCIEKRKVELKIKECKKLNQKELREIFMKIFPDFCATEIFGNMNWKNQIGELIKNSKIRISKLIRADEGISILKRYGIVFFRTF